MYFKCVTEEAICVKVIKCFTEYDSYVSPTPFIQNTKLFVFFMRVCVYIVHIYCVQVYIVHIYWVHVNIVHIVQDAVRGLMAMYDDSEADF